VPARAAAFTSSDAGSDLVRLASQQEVDLLVLDADGFGLDGLTREGPLRTVLDDAPCDVALLTRGAARGAAEGPVLVPFGAGEHEWAALELGAWSASAHDVPLRLLGATADEESGRRDASRLLASASLVVQQLAGVMTDPVLVPPGAAGVIETTRDALVVVLGFPERWRQEGLGDVRAAIAAESASPVLLVRRGLRPGGLSPQEGLTRYTWSLAASENAAAAVADPASSL
jgi:nucleotide-binding universal stress UspA family protein